MNKKTFVLLRTIYLNGTIIEKDRFFGHFHDRDAADKRAQALDDGVFKNTAIRGLSFTFYVKEVMSDTTDE